MRININSDAVVQHTNRLERMHRSALPIAIRDTLNNAAFDVKQNTMPAKASTDFKNRQKNFFKANSRVDKADGFNIASMKSTVGFVEGGLKGGNNYAVKDLEQQEHGGKIDKKGFIPTLLARAGGNNMGLVKANARLSKIRNIIKAKNSPGKNKKERFVIAAAVAGKGGFVLSGNILFRIDTAPRSNIRSGATKFKSTAVYSFKKGRSVNVRPTHFMEEASEQTQRKMDNFFIKNAERQINRLR